MSRREDKIAIGNFSSSLAISGGNLIPPTGSSNNTWGEIWWFFVLSPCFATTAYATYRFLNQPRMELKYYYATASGSTWNEIAHRQIEGNTDKREAIFGHNMELGQQHGGDTDGGPSTVYFDFNHSKNHLWCIGTRRYRNSDWGNGHIRIYNIGNMGTSRYNSYIRGSLSNPNKVKACPKLSLSVGTSTSSSAFIFHGTSNSWDSKPLTPSQARSYFNTNNIRGTKITYGMDWAINQGIE